jgi:hypothetical protein
LNQGHKVETGSYEEAREKALDELTFTLFNRLAAIKVMEAHQLFPPIITKEAENGDRSFGHKVWLEQNPEMRNKELEGICEYLKDEFIFKVKEVGSNKIVLLPYKDQKTPSPYYIVLNQNK